MNCIYCQRNLHEGGTGIYICLSCPASVQYICAGSLPVPEIYYIQFYKNKYQLEINLVDQRATLVYLPFGGPPSGAYVAKTVIEFDKPPQVTPTTYEDWLDRILSMKAFF